MLVGTGVFDGPQTQTGAASRSPTEYDGNPHQAVGVGAFDDPK